MIGTAGRRGWVLGVVLAVGALVASATPAAAAAGGLDTTFSGDGRLLLDLTGGFDPSFEVEVQDDGRILVAGRAGGAGGRMFVLRYTDTGVLDTTFSGDGKAFVDFTPGADFAFGLALQLDGKIVLSGGTQSGRLAVARLNADGTPDTLFDGDGKVLLNPTSIQDIGYKVEIGPLNQIIVAGDIGDHTGVVQLTPTGGLDPTFGGGDGIGTVDYVGGRDRGLAMAVQDDGAIVVSGHAETSTDIRSTVTRFTPTGAPDPAFSGDGKFAIDLITGYEDQVGVAIQPDDNIVVVGESNLAISLMRLTPTGGFDNTFSGDGRARSNLPGGAEWASAVVIDGDGRLVISGGIGGGGGQALVARYTPAGLRDTTFSGDGWRPTNFTPAFDWSTDLALDGDGDIVSVGTADDDRRLFVQRVLAA